MSAFLICTPSETDWRISPEDLERLAREHWSDVEASQSDDPDRPHPTHLVIRGHGPTIIAGLHRDGSTLFVEGDVDQAVAVARWFRRQVPPDQQLIFFDEAYTTQVDLGPETTAEQLAGPFATG